jgi:hypothetical protein
VATVSVRKHLKVLKQIMTYQKEELMQFRTEISYEHRNNNSGRDNTGGIATRFGLDDLGFEIQLGRNVVYTSSPGSGSAQPPAKWVPGHFPGGKAAGVWRWTPTPFYGRGKKKV